MATKEQNAANAEVMRHHIASYKTSGLSVQQYCKDNNLSVHRFNYWHYKHQKAQTATGFSRVRPPAIQKPASAASTRNPTVEVTLTNGNRVAFFESNSLDLFKALL